MVERLQPSVMEKNEEREVCADKEEEEQAQAETPREEEQASEAEEEYRESDDRSDIKDHDSEAEDSAEEESACDSNRKARDQDKSSPTAEPDTRSSTASPEPSSKLEEIDNSSEDEGGEEDKETEPSGAHEEKDGGDEPRSESGRETNKLASREKMTAIQSNSKLEDAAALSASLSSSRCLLKRAREQAGRDSEGEEEEEPDSKKSNVGTEPVQSVPSKLTNTELLASLSSSKSILKRGIEKVESGSDAPDSKKSNLSQTPTRNTKHAVPDNSPDEESKQTEKEKLKEKIKTPVKSKFSKNPVQKILFSPQSTQPNLPIAIAGPPVGISIPSPAKERVLDLASQPASSPLKSVREETRPVIGAKELAEERKLEKKRLNKMLSIFKD